MVMKFGSLDHPQVNPNRNFYRLVYIVIFSIRNRANQEKAERTKFYQQLYYKPPKHRKQTDNDPRSQGKPKS